MINKLENYLGPTISNGKPITPALLTKRQKTVNRLGGEKMIMKGLEFGLRVQDEINNFISPINHTWTLPNEPFTKRTDSPW